MEKTASDRLQRTMNFIAQQRGPRGDGGAYVYLVGCKGFVKIGIATDPYDRLNQMQVGNPFRLVLLGTLHTFTPIEDEAAFHAKFAKWGVRGEWFKMPAAVQERLLERFKGGRLP